MNDSFHHTENKNNGASFSDIFISQKMSKMVFALLLLLTKLMRIGDFECNSAINIQERLLELLVPECVANKCAAKPPVFFQI